MEIESNHCLRRADALLAIGESVSKRGMRYLMIIPFLAACAPTVPTRDDFTPSCGAENFVRYIGGSADVLQNIDLPRASRILRPDQAISLDFSPDRLTIDVDQLNRVSSVTCR